MANKRLNSQKIAKQPKLKKDIAFFLAKVDVYFKTIGSDVVTLLANGHRGYISYNEKSLTKLLEEKWKLLEAQREEILKAKKSAEEARWGADRIANGKYELLIEANRLMDELMDQILLG